MKRGYFILILVFLISCKKENTPVLAGTKSVLDVFQNTKIGIDSLLISKYKSKDLMLFYKNYNLETVWQSIDHRKIIIQEIANADIEGLNPKDYNIEKLLDYENKINNLSENELVAYDILLTNSLQKYLIHVVKGKLSPRKLYDDWDLKEKDFDVNKILFEAYSNNKITEAINESKPKQEVYLQLKKALQIINLLPEDYFKPMSISSKSKINLNENNALIIPVKKRLMYWNYLTKSDTITKKFDAKTQIALKEFQVNHGLLADGIIGSGTIRALNFYKSERKEQIIANLERWRWFPDDFGTHYTIVNIPDFSILAIKDKDTLINQRVIVGTDKRRSPVLTTKLSYVVFNPTWTVPPTIIKEDLIPAATRSRGYFKRMRIVIYDTKRNKINPYSWKPENAKKYSYVQDPGNNNSLGNMKIIFPNKYSVYLHDTNHKDGFSRNSRSLSSGCTRVERPLELAQYVLNDTIKWNKETIDSVLVTKKPKNVNITDDIKHYQLYWTAWSKKNRLIFRDDIYNMDFELYCKLRN